VLSTAISVTVRDELIFLIEGISFLLLAFEPSQLILHPFYSASDSAYSHAFIRSVRGLSSVVCLSHSCTLLRPFDGFRCHLAGTIVRSIGTLC